MEIEKKYLIKDVPRDINSYPHVSIEQAYLCTDPTLRVRRYGNRYILTYKKRINDPSKLNVSEEIESELSYEAYEHLFSKADGTPIRKTRYKIPYGEHVIELDIFHGAYEGLYLAEVEFESVSEGESFVPPAWFGDDVSDDVRYTNAYLTMHSST